MNCSVQTTDSSVVQPPQVPGKSNPFRFGLDRWRRRRVTIRIAVSLEYADGEKAISVPAHTVWVNDNEALLVTQQELPAGLRVELKQSFTGDRQAGCMVQSQLQRVDGFYAGIQFESPVPGFWHIVFPGSRL